MHLYGIFDKKDIKISAQTLIINEVCKNRILKLRESERVLNCR